MAGVIKDAYAPLGYKSVTSRRLPDFMVRFFGFFDKTAADMAPMLGQHFRIDCSQVRDARRRPGRPQLPRPPPPQPLPRCRA